MCRKNKNDRIIEEFDKSTGNLWLLGILFRNTLKMIETFKK